MNNDVPSGIRLRESELSSTIAVPLSGLLLT